jgi:hypothetical protein
LTQETAATMGTYDKHEYWDFIAYKGKNEGLVANKYSVDEWWDEFTVQAMDILDTVCFKSEDLSTTKGIYYDDTEAADIGLSLRIDNVRGLWIQFHSLPIKKG